MMRSSVLLPQPLGPTTETNSPSAIEVDPLERDRPGRIDLPEPSYLDPRHRRGFLHPGKANIEGMTTRRRFLAAATALGAVAATRTRPAAAADPKPLTIGYVPSTLFAPVFVAVDRGYLSDRGFAPSMTPIVAGQDAVALLAQGQLDVVAGGLSAAFFNGVARGFDVRLVGSTGYQPRKGHPSALVVRQDLWDGGLRSVKDLRGKKVAWIGGNGAVSTYYVARILRPAGLTLADIEVVNLSNPDQGVAFERKAIDAAFTPAPFTTAFQDRKLAHPLAWPPAGISGTGIFFGSTLLGSPDVAARALAAFRQASAEVAGKAYDMPPTWRVTPSTRNRPSRPSKPKTGTISTRSSASTSRPSTTCRNSSSRWAEWSPTKRRCPTTN